MEITPAVAQSLYKECLRKGLITDEKAVIVYSKQALDFRLDILRSFFPSTTLHAIAIKTCAEMPVLRHIAERGFGLEAASIEEVMLAVGAGVKPGKIVFDSPVKTREEISYCHMNLPGMLVNANSIAELGRYPPDFNCKVGLRINPLVESNAPGMLNVASEDSKFGVPISQRKQILEACIQYPQICCLHVHIGSNIRDFAASLEAVVKQKQLADDVNNARKEHGIKEKITSLDIGGGIDFELNGRFTVQSFVNKLNEIPALFENYNIITEYGTFVHRQSSFVVSNVEYVIPGEGDVPSKVYLHVGADLFVRRVYSQIPIHYPFSIMHADARIKREEESYRVVGPLCFAGDVLYEHIKAQTISEEDKFVILDTGANTISMWSHHCNRMRPKFIFV